MAVVHQNIFNSLNKYALLAVPFFIFAGDLMSRGGISNRLLRWVASMIGGFRAHIPMTSLGFAALFGAISGVTTAATAAIGTLTYPRMREAGYSERFASALITAEGALDNLIPPSIAMIIYGIASDTSVIQLFAAGIGPGLLLAGMFGVYIYYHSWRVGIMESGQILVQGISARHAGRRLGDRRHRHHLRRHLFGRVLADRGRRRRLHLRDFRQLFRLSRNDVARDLRDRRARSMYLTGLIFIIVSVAGLYAWLLTISGIAQDHGVADHRLHSERWVVLLVINAVPAVRRLLP